MGGEERGRGKTGRAEVEERLRKLEKLGERKEGLKRRKNVVVKNFKGEKGRKT